LCPKCVEDGSGEGQEGDHDGDHDGDTDELDDERAEERKHLNCFAVGHLEFFWTRRTEHNFPEWKSQQDGLLGRMQPPHSNIFIYIFFIYFKNIFFKVCI